jgi:Fe-S-cluster containining protein
MQVANKPWYHEGLRFECTQCGDCCTGAPGFVWVNKEEIAALAEAIGEKEVDYFEDQHIRRIGIRKSLREFSNGDCVFFDGEARKCTVYDARPRQCRTWPFWDSNLKSAKSWQKTCEVCPGSGKGELHQLEDIEKHRKVVRV